MDALKHVISSSMGITNPMSLCTTQSLIHRRDQKHMRPRPCTEFTKNFPPRIPNFCHHCRKIQKSSLLLSSLSFSIGLRTLNTRHQNYIGQKIQLSNFLKKTHSWYQKIRNSMYEKLYIFIFGI